MTDKERFDKLVKEYEDLCYKMLEDQACYGVGIFESTPDGLTFVPYEDYVNRLPTKKGD